MLSAPSSINLPVAPTAAERPALPALTGLRFIAAMLVVAYHFGPSSASGCPWWLRNIMGAGFCGVNLFFVLSGFVLTYVYAPLKWERATLEKFWSARVARIYPVYLFSLLVAAAPYFAGVFARNPPTKAAAKSVVMLGSWLTLTQSWLGTWLLGAWNAPAWSLSVEWFFYLVFPLFARQLLRPQPQTSVVVRLGLLWLAALAVPLLYLAIGPDHVGWHDRSGNWLDIIKYNPILQLPSFLCGITLGHAYLARPDRNRRGAAPIRFLLVAGVVLLGVTLVGSSLIPYVLLHNGFMIPFFGMIIFGAAAHAGRISATLSVAPMIALGEASYAIYILHWPLHDLLGRVVTPTALATPLGFVAYSLATIAVALAVYRYIEVPMRKRTRQILFRRARSTQP